MFKQKGSKYLFEACTKKVSMGLVAENTQIVEKNTLKKKSSPFRDIIKSFIWCSEILSSGYDNKTVKYQG